MAWYNANWQYRAKITADKTKVGSGGVSDWPNFFNLANLGSGHGFWGHVKAAGADIRITTSDGTTECPIEVVAIDTTGKTGEIHFKGSQSSATDTEYYIYYGNSGASAYGASDTYGKNNVWKSEYRAVWHLTDLNDSTSRGNTLSNPNSAATTTTAKVGLGAYDLSGDHSSSANGTRLTISNVATLMGSSDESYFCFQGWVRFDQITGICALICEANASGSPWILNQINFGDTPDSCMFDIRKAGGSGDTYIQKNENLSADTWCHFTLIIDKTDTSNTAMKMYKNGVDQGLTMNRTIASTDDYTGADEIAWGSYNNRSYGLNGKFDELRVLNTVPTAAWVTTDFNCQNDNSAFWKTIGAEETNGTTYTLTASVGSFTLTGINSILKKIYTAILSTGSFVLTGISAIFYKAFVLAASTGNFVLTGINLSIIKSLRIALSTGSFVLTGISAIFNKTKMIICQTGSFLLAGSNALIYKATIAVLQTVSFTLIGVDATFLKAKVLFCQTGSFVLTGFNIFFRGTGWLWSAISKNISSWSNGNKNNSNWDNQTKN